MRNRKQGKSTPGASKRNADEKRLKETRERILTASTTPEGLLIGSSQTRGEEIESKEIDKERVEDRGESLAGLEVRL